MNLFLVDDSAIIRQRIATLLQVFPQVEITGQFENDTAAIEGIAQKPPDVILLDLELGSTNTNGLNVLHYASRHFPRIKVIVLTNHSDGLTRSQCLKAGAYRFLDKTFEFDKVPNLLLTHSMTWVGVDGVCRGSPSSVPPLSHPHSLTATFFSDRRARSSSFVLLQYESRLLIRVGGEMRTQYAHDRQNPRPVSAGSARIARAMG
jgi:CheY-like chemotaxis protein